MTIKDFTPGQTVYIIERHAFRPCIMQERIVHHIGRKYVTLDGRWKEQYGVEDERHNYLTEKADYGTKRILFATLQAAEQYQERTQLIQKVSSRIHYSMPYFNIDQLRQLSGWMDEINSIRPKGTRSTSADSNSAELDKKGENNDQ